MASMYIYLIRKWLPKQGEGEKIFPLMLLEKVITC